MLRGTLSRLDTPTAAGPMIYLIENRPPDTFSSSTEDRSLGQAVTVSTSKCEAEYIAQTEAACEAVWIRGLLGELGVLRILEEESFLKTIAPPTVIFADNQGAIELISNPEYHRKTKHSDQIP